MLYTVQESTFCPYCGEKISLLVDQSIGDQEYIEDCEVCCRPMVIHSLVPERGDPIIIARGEND
ncbi:MAG: CPXCG motif-containing cysteine-rich protein [Halioglobus sp.]